MRYLIDIRVGGGKSRTYPIEAKDEDEALERLKLRLPPKQREAFVVDALKIDPKSFDVEEPYGTFGGE